MSTEYLSGVKYIELTQGKYAIVDDWVEPLVNQYKWHFDDGYAKRNTRVDGKWKRLGMHTFIWNIVKGGIPVGLFVDHIRGYKLDNRLSELRLVDRRLNRVNTEAYRKGLTTSSYPGVSWDKYRSRWSVKFKIGGKTYNVGRFLLEEDAAAAYWKALENWEERGELPNKRRNL